MDKEILKYLRKKTERKVTSLFEKYTPSYLIYHNIQHTKSVVDHSLEIAAHYTLTEEEQFILFVAAWFHDTGQIYSIAALHEEESVQLANYFLQGYPEIPSPVILAIDHCILATKLPQRPHTLTEQILCDADLYHFGTGAFLDINEKVKKEATLRGMNTDRWNEATLKMVQVHQFHTDFCRQKLAEGKAINTAELLLLLKKQKG